MTERSTAYVTADGQGWMVLTHEDGLVPPPMLRLHRPLAGEVEYYFAECYHLPVPEAADRYMVEADRPERRAV